MTRARKWLIGVGVAIAALIVAIVAALFWLLYTPSGLRFALDRGVAAMEGQFTYASASGTLAGETTIEGLRYRDESGDRLRIRRAAVALEPWALLAGRLHVQQARIDGIEVALAPSQKPDKSDGFSLEPPLTVVLDDVLLTDITITMDGTPVFAADSLAIAGRWTDTRLELDRFALSSPDGSANLTGTLGFARGYRGQGKAKIDWRYQGTRYTAELAVRPDGDTLHLHGAMTSPVQLQLDGTLHLGQHHAWTLDLHVPRFDAGELPALPSSLETLALDLEGSGDATGGTLTGSIVANGYKVLIDPLRFRYDDKTLTLDPLRLRAAEGPGVMTVNGMAHLDQSPIGVSLDVSWQDVHLPADLVGQTLATHGEVHVTGSAAQYAVTGALAIGPPGQLSNVQLDVAGTPQGIEINTFKLVQKGGRLEAQGHVGFEPTMSWQIEAVANDFNPGAFIAGWSGAMDFKLATRGTLTPDGPDATFKLTDVGGTLRGRKIAGKGDFAIHPGNLFDGSLQLAIGNSRIRAAGTGGKRTDARIDLDIASLNDWMPDASGSLHGTFHVTGSWPALGIRGELHGGQLALSGTRIDTLKLDIAVPDISKPGGDLDLVLGGVHASGLEFETVTLEGHGTQGAHKLTLHARGEQLGVALNLEGGWNAKARRWSGTVSDVELTPQGMPAWRQQQPSAITWRHGALTLEQFCLGAGEPRFCVAGNRSSKGVITAQYDLEQLPLQMFASLVESADPLRASGELSGSGRLAIAQGGAITGQASLSVGPGSIAYASRPNRALLAWTGIEANLDASGDRQRLRLKGTLADGGRIAGDITLSGSEHALAGDIDVNLRSLAFLEALSAEIANVQGSLVGQLTLGGTLSEPRFQGNIQTQGFSAELPRAGLELHDGAIAISGDEQGQLRIEGQITSGKGVLHISGVTGLSADAPLTLDIKGENVLVADIPAAHVVASPDLHLGRADGEFTIDGSIAIPSASIELEKLPGQGPAKASPDIVIVDAPPGEETAPLAVKGEIVVKLGDDVKVTGYGLDGKVQGSLAVRVRPGHAATGRGQISVSGTFRAYGQNLTIDHGRLLFAGTRLDNPGLDIRAVRELRSQDVTVGLSIRGTAQDPILTVFSDPSMEQAEALSYLVTGRPLNSLSGGEGDTLAIAAQALGGLAGNRLAKSIGSRLGLEAGVSSSEALGGAAFTAGKYLSPRLFISYGVGLFTPGEVITLRYTINRFLQFVVENATTGNRASLNYQIEK